MTEKEAKLLEMIRNYENPGEAMAIAAKIIIDFLAQLESCEEQAPADLRELA
jgi:hypothetical protein